MKGKVPVLFLVGLSLGMVLGFSQAEEVSVTTVVTPASQAQIIEAGGSIKIDGADVVVGTALEAGSTVEAVNYTILKINTEATNLIRMEPGSKLTIEAFFAGDGGVSDIFVFQGSKIYGLIEDLPSGSDFTVETPTAVVGVRGTEFSVGVDAALPYATSLEVFDVSPGHTVDITEKSEGSADIIIKQGVEVVKNLFHYFRQGTWPITTAEAASPAGATIARKGQKKTVSGLGQAPQDAGRANQAAWDERKGGVENAGRKAKGGLLKPVIKTEKRPRAGALSPSGEDSGDGGSSGRGLTVSPTPAGGGSAETLGERFLRIRREIRAKVNQWLGNLRRNRQ